jgi:hypothetical protein
MAGAKADMLLLPAPVASCHLLPLHPRSHMPALLPCLMQPCLPASLPPTSTLLGCTSSTTSLMLILVGSVGSCSGSMLISSSRPHA